MRKLKTEEIDRMSAGDLEAVPRHPVTVVVNDVRSIYNVGSIFRTSDAARIEQLCLTGYTGTPAHKDIHKTALGAQDVVPWSAHDDARPLLSDLRAQGYTLAVLEITDTPSQPDDLALEHFPLCLVLGNEVHGVDQAIVEAADVALEIPQFGVKHSLNVSVAYGIAIFDIVRRYRALHDIDQQPTA